MRHILLAALATLLVVSPASAKDPKLAGIPIFGHRNCKPAFPCPNTMTREQNVDIAHNVIGIATQCARSYLGVRKPDILFEEAFGLDASMCLTTVKIEPDESGSALIPRCCIIPVDETGKVCQVSCTLYGMKN